MSKSLFLLLFLVASLAGAVSLKAGGSRLGELGLAAKMEFTADVRSLKDDLRDMREQMELLPAEMSDFWTAARREAKMAANNTTQSARDVAHRVASLIKTS